MSATLREVAAKAGVATSTVSRALRNHPKIPVETRERIQNLARQMGYQPDPLITALIDRRWNRNNCEYGTIAWVNSLTAQPSRGDWFNPVILEAARARAESLGYHLEEFWLKEKGMTGRRLSDILIARGIRGVCVAPLAGGSKHMSLKWENFSLATIGYSMQRPNLHRACPHQFQGIGVALRELRRKGYRRIGVYMSEDENRRVNYHWAAGTLLFQQQNPKIRTNLLIGVSEDQSKFLEWVSAEKLDYVLGSNETVERWLSHSGQEIACGTLAWNRYLAMEGIDQKFPEVSAAAIDLVVNQLRRNETGVPASPTVVMVEGEWKDCA